jgi:hypothetical protein
MPSPFCPETRIDLREQPTTKTLPVGLDRLDYSASNNVIELHVPPRNPVAYQSVPPYPLGVWAVTRRLMAEGRDRVAPMLSFANTAR